MSSRDEPPSEADESSLTPAQVQRAREAILVSLDYTEGTSGIQVCTMSRMTNWYPGTVLTKSAVQNICKLTSICMIYHVLHAVVLNGIIM